MLFPFIIPSRGDPMAEQELPIQQDDELDVEELEAVDGGALSDAFADDNSGCNNCPNTNCPCV
jgi:hypothetical protein